MFFLIFLLFSKLTFFFKMELLLLPQDVLNPVVLGVYIALKWKYRRLFDIVDYQVFLMHFLLLPHKFVYLNFILLYFFFVFSVLQFYCHFHILFFTAVFFNLLWGFSYLRGGLVLVQDFVFFICVFDIQSRRELKIWVNWLFCCC